jgi:RNA polymerase sigma-70 factor (ECF subfamily)
MGIFNHKFIDVKDEQLMSLSKEGNQAAFEVLYDRYKQRLINFFYRMLGGNSDKAQDFLQETFLRVVRNMSCFCEEKNFSSWIFTIAHNLCKNEYRRLEVRRIIENSEEIEQVGIGAEESNRNIENRIDYINFQNALFKELNLLDSEKFCTFVLRYLENFSIKEISEIMSCSEGTVKSRLFYTTKKIADRLKKFNPNIFGEQFT